MASNTIKASNGLPVDTVTSTITGYLLMVCVVAQKFPQALQLLLSALSTSVQLRLSPALALLASVARSVGKVTRGIARKFVLKAAMQGNRIRQAVLQVQAGIRPKTATPDINQSLLTALNMQAGSRQIARTVSVLLSNTAGASSIRLHVLQQALLLAVQQQNFTTVRDLARLPLARKAVGKPPSDGEGLLSLAFTAPAALSQEDGRALLEDLCDRWRHLHKRMRLSAADLVLLIRMEVALALLESPAAPGLPYSDLLAAAQHVIPLLALPLGTEANVGKYTAAFHNAARLILLIPQQGHSTNTVIGLLQHCLGSVPGGPRRQWQLLLQIADGWAADMKQAVAELAIVTAERDRYVYAYNSLAAEQKQLERTSNSSSSAAGWSRLFNGSVNARLWHSRTPARSNSLVQDLRAAVAEGRKCLTKQLLEAQMVWPSLALRKHGLEVLLLAIETGDMDMLRLVLTAVAAASHGENASAGSLTATTAAQMAQQKLSLAIAAGSKGGLDFLTVINESVLAPTALEWANGVNAAYIHGDQERAVACLKGMFLSHSFGNQLEDKANQALTLLKHGGAHPPPDVLFAAVVESCGSDLRQKVEEADGLHKAISQGLAHFFGRLAVLWQDVELMRSAAQPADLAVSLD